MIPVAEPNFDESELDNVIHAVKTGWVSSKGSFIPEFEMRFAQYCDVKYGVATCNGPCALLPHSLPVFGPGSATR